MNDTFTIKEGDSFQLTDASVDLLGIVEKTNERISLPVCIIKDRQNYKALADEQDGYVLVIKRKVVEIENGRRVLADIYIPKNHIAR